MLLILEDARDLNLDDLPGEVLLDLNAVDHHRRDVHLRCLLVECDRCSVHLLVHMNRLKDLSQLIDG